MERWRPGRLRWVCATLVRSGVGWMAMWLWFAMVSEGYAQSPPGAKLEFDVASVRQNKSGETASSTFSLDNGNVYSTVNKGDVFTPRGSYFAATNQPLWRYIAFAYNLSGTQELA